MHASPVHTFLLDEVVLGFFGCQTTEGANRDHECVAQRAMRLQCCPAGQSHRVENSVMCAVPEESLPDPLKSPMPPADKSALSSEVLPADAPHLPGLLLPLIISAVVTSADPPEIAPVRVLPLLI